MNYPECTGSARHRQDEIVANVTHLPILQSLVLPSVKRGSSAVNDNENTRGVYSSTIIQYML